MSRKEAEADLLMQSAKAHHTKSLTKWSSDWDSAASDYEKAAQIFTHLNLVPKARVAWEAASNAHEKAKNPFFAARCVESLANFLRDQEEFVRSPEGAAEVSRLFVRASNMYALDMKPDRQAEALAKAARLAPANDAASAAKLILQGLDALEENGKHHMTLDLYRSVVLLQVRGNLILDAIATLKRQAATFEKLGQPTNGAKAGLEIIVLCLSLGDTVLANREMTELQNKNFFGFLHSREHNAALALLRAVDEHDEDGVAEALADQTFQFIIPEISRMAKKLSTKKPGAARKAGGAAAAAAAPAARGGGAVGAGSGGRRQMPADDDDEEDLR